MSNYDHLSLCVPESSKPRVVIIGAGFAGINLAKRLKNKNLQVVLFDRHNYHTFQPLLYQVATAGLEPDSVSAPLRKLFDHYEDFHFRMIKILAIHPETNTISTVIGDLHYDYLVIATGSTTNFFGNEALSQRSFQIKEVPLALDLRSQLLQSFEEAMMTIKAEDIARLMTFVIVGGGPTGVEVAGAMAEMRQHILPNDYPGLEVSKMKIYLIQSGPRLLNTMSDYASRKALEYLTRMGVKVKLESVVKSFDGEVVELRDGERLFTRNLIWAAGVKGNVVGGLGADCIAKDRILVDSCCRVKGYGNVFAAGDVALMQTEKMPVGHPMLAPVAIQQGAHLARNLVRLTKGKTALPFRYLDKGTMATIGRNQAVVDLPFGIRFGGFLAWIAWMAVHLFYLIGFRNRMVVITNWVWSYLTYDRGVRIIIRPFINRKVPGAEEYILKNEIG